MGVLLHQACIFQLGFLTHFWLIREEEIDNNEDVMLQLLTALAACNSVASAIRKVLRQLCFRCLNSFLIAKATEAELQAANAVNWGEPGSLLCKQAALPYFEYVAVNRDGHVRLQ